ncbi:RIP metalloprotease RseP [Lachnospiraceae bacterium AM25-11LB]|nr:RIP metalloprotease RseP [Lachnospiraceae bacterium AM25-22]RGD09236.1 RIP metalloprotease RseP [Lachnospiraceae bacterium AM25-11LB]RJW13463.1 RIP metalloprotease RseP [Lachnospiraceae bacterium AM25-40]RJW18175.1 RIP metalloprotease RseP [Lachnospiraceae bacterium AM25-39]
MKILIAILIFSVIIIFHELGHFLLAKRNGIKVTEFSLGMGPRLLSTQKGETRYSLKLFPIGGSCMMVGEDDDDDSEGSFNKASVWARISVVAAGPIFNFILAFVFAMIITSVAGYDPARVLQVEENSPAAKAGLQEGDIITEFQGRNIVLGRDLDSYMMLHGLEDEDITLIYKRDGKEKEVSFEAYSEEKYMLGFSYVPTPDGEPEVTQVVLNGAMMEAGVQVGDIIREINGEAIETSQEIQEYWEKNPLDGSEISLGIERDGEVQTISLKPQMTKQIDTGFVYNLYREKTNFLGVLRYSASEVRYWISNTIESLMMLIKGQFSVNDLSGPVGIIDVIGDSYEEAKEEGTVMVWLQMLYWAILLSANLGVMNLLPIPALDGGRLVFLAVEAVRKKKLDPNVEGMIHFVGFVLLMLLMVFVMFNDFRRL